MANYNCVCRTNYFKVNDSDRFKAIMKESAPAMKIREEKDNTFSFGDYDSLSSEDELRFFEKLQPLLPDGEALVFYEIGHEKLNYLVASAIIVTNKNVLTVNLESHVEALAKVMTSNPDFVLHNEY